MIYLMFVLMSLLGYFFLDGAREETKLKYQYFLAMFTGWEILVIALFAVFV